MPGEILDCPDCGAELTLAGWSQHNGAWCAVDLSDLLAGPEVRGDSILVERLAGRVLRDRVPDETTYSIPYVFSGAVDRDGTPYVDADAGLALNRRAFIGQVATGQVITGSYVEPDGTEFTGDCIVLPRIGWVIKPGALALATVRIVIGPPWAEAGP